MSKNKVTHMTDDELNEINKKIDDWKKANPDWEKMHGIKGNLNLFKIKTRDVKSRKAAYTSLKLHFKTTSDIAQYSDDSSTEDLIKDGYLNSSGLAWESPFSTRRKTTEVDPTIDEIMKYRLDFAKMLDDDYFSSPEHYFGDGDIEKVNNIIQITMNYVKTLKFEVRNKSSINADNPVHNFTSWVDKMTYDNEIMKNTLKYAWKNREVELDAMVEVKEGKNKGKLSRKPHSDYKWDGSLENGLEINFTPKNRSRSVKN